MSREIPEVQLEEYALKLDAKDFASRSKAKAKPQRRGPAGPSTRTIPVGKRTWTDVEPGEYSFSDYAVSKKLIHLLRHARIQREDDGAVEFWRIKDNLQKHVQHCIVIIGLTTSVRKAWQEEEETRKDTSIVLIYQEQFFTSELFKVIQDAISLILLYRTMLLLRATSSNTFIMSDVQSINLHSNIDSGLVLGGQNLNNRETVFFLPVDPMDKTIGILIRST